MRIRTFAGAVVVIWAATAPAAEPLGMVSLTIDGAAWDFTVTSGPMGGASTFEGTETDSIINMRGEDGVGGELLFYLMVSPTVLFADLDIVGQDGSRVEADMYTGVEVMLSYVRTGPRNKVESRIGGTAVLYPGIGDGYVGEGSVVQIRGSFEALLPEAEYVISPVVPLGD